MLIKARHEGQGNKLNQKYIYLTNIKYEIEIIK